MLVGRYTFKNIHEKYSDIIDFSLPLDDRHLDGTRMSLFNSAELIEIAIYRSNLETVGGASNLLGIKYRDQLTVIFKDADTNR